MANDIPFERDSFDDEFDARQSRKISPFINEQRMLENEFFARHSPRGNLNESDDIYLFARNKKNNKVQAFIVGNMNEFRDAKVVQPPMEVELNMREWAQEFANRLFPVSDLRDMFEDLDAPVVNLFDR